MFSLKNILIQVAEVRAKTLIVLSCEQITNLSLDRIWIPVIASEIALIILMQLFVSRHQIISSPLIDPLITLSNDKTLLKVIEILWLFKVWKQSPLLISHILISRPVPEF